MPRPFGKPARFDGGGLLSRARALLRAGIVSDPREVPPTPGTEPRVGEANLPRYREDPEIYARHRRDGTHPYTLGEVNARVTAVAHDLAAAGGSGPVRPPLLSELVSIFWHRLYRGLPVARLQLARHGRTEAVAATRRNIATENRDRHAQRRRELASDQKRIGRPVTGVTLSRQWVLAVCLLAAAAIETIGSTPSIEQAFDASREVAAGFAFAISMFLIVTADQVGNYLASVGSASRRVSAAIAALLAVLALGAGTWSIVSLAESRAANLAYEDAVAKSRSQVDLSGHIGGDDAQRAAGESAGVASPPSAATADEKPDFDFFIPLSIFVLAASILVAFRIEVAREWNDLEDQIEDAVLAEDEEREGEEEARRQINEGDEDEGEALQELAAYAERERRLLTGWIARFQDEYQRFCAASGLEPRRVEGPEVPSLGEILAGILDPAGLRGGRQPEAAAATDDGAPQDGPDEGGAAEVPPPGPVPGPGGPRGPARRRRSRDGRPRTFSSLDGDGNAEAA